jgi:hypothetical protein
MGARALRRSSARFRIRPSPDSGVELTVVMKPVQVACTEVLLNAAPRRPRKSGPRNPLPGVFFAGAFPAAA